MAVPSEREYGALEKEVAEIRHDLRNQRMVCNSHGEDIAELRQDVERLKTRLTTGIAIFIAAIGATSWIIELLISKGW